MMMMNEEKQPVDVSKQPIVFFWLYQFSIFLLLLFLNLMY